MSIITHSMKALLKKIILFLPRGNELLSKMIQYRNKLHPAPQDAHVEEQSPGNGPVNTKELFTAYYRNNYWGNKESVSGPGSTLKYTEHIRIQIPELLEQYKILKFLDAPCGDYHWFQAMKRPQGMEYIGGDIVEELVEQNQAKYGNDQTRFISMDIINDLLPPADLWMCRDCLFHFSYEDIFKTLVNFLRSDIGYILTSVHPVCAANTDITTGGARQLNLELPPFKLCRPILYIDDWIPGYTVRKMGMWARWMVAGSLASNPEMHKYLPVQEGLVSSRRTASV